MVRCVSSLSWHRDPPTETHGFVKGTASVASSARQPSHPQATAISMMSRHLHLFLPFVVVVMVASPHPFRRSVHGRSIDGLCTVFPRAFMGTSRRETVRVQLDRRFLFESKEIVRIEPMAMAMAKRHGRTPVRASNAHEWKRKRGAKVLISTGDTMADIHAASLVRAMHRLARERGMELQVDALAGIRTEDAGAKLIGNTASMSSIGLWEALPLVWPSLQLQKVVRDHVKRERPDVAVLLDYPGVNIPFQKFLKKDMALPCIYYIPPNEWLWSKSRTNSVCKYSDKILSVFPSELRHFQQAGGNVEFVGHPLVDQVSHAPQKREAREMLSIQTDGPVIVLLPASRKQEVRYVWPILARAAAIITQRMGNEQRPTFVISVIDDEFQERIELIAAEVGLDVQQLVFWKGDSRVALSAADLALTKSGSVNVELALLGVPQVVAYRLDQVTAQIAKLLRIKFEHVSLVNVIMEEKIVPEYIQEEANPEVISNAALKLLSCSTTFDPGALEKQLEGYRRLEVELGGPGASDRVAEEVLAFCP